MKLTKSKRINYLLKEQNLNSYRDILKYYPYRYENLSPSDESNLKNDARVVLKGTLYDEISEIDNITHKLFTFNFLSENNNLYHVVCLNQLFLNNENLKTKKLTIVGKYKSRTKDVIALNIFSSELPSNFLPQYHLIKGIPSKSYLLLVKKAYEFYVLKLEDILPNWIREKYHFISKKDAIKLIHFPTSKDDIKEALKYLKYEEAICYILTNYVTRIYYQNNVKINGKFVPFSSLLPLINSLTYKLTNDQENAVKEILKDLNSKRAMYRLLQGDVGCGKTIVAFLILYANYLKNKQGILLVPTEALALQHMDKISKLLSSFKVKISLLVGSLTPAKKEEIIKEINEGKTDIIIGTHSLLNERIIYHNLGLAIIDEQHRFGVKQRKSLLKNLKSIDLLMLSATPIPRTLALGLYGNLDVTSIKNGPKNNKIIITKVMKSYDENIFKLIDKMLSLKRQVYVIAPRIDYENLSDFSIDNLSKIYRLKYGKKVGVLNGKLSSKNKENILRKFYNHEIDILLSTIVIEVGIDVKNASLLIVYGANNFGFATLHQLRGRVGRDGYKSYCILTYDGRDIIAYKKLKILEKINDGFLLSKYDLKCRGFGEINGLKQSGKNEFSLLNVFNDFPILEAASKDASLILKHKDNEDNFAILKYIDFFIRYNLNKNK